MNPHHQDQCQEADQQLPLVIQEQDVLAALIKKNRQRRHLARVPNQPEANQSVPLVPLHKHRKTTTTMSAQFALR